MSAMQVALIVAQVIGLPALILFYLRDRRKSRAESNVAERTVQHQVDLSSVTAIEAHVAMVEKAYAVERSSYERQIAALTSQRDIALADAELKRLELEQMRVELERLRAQVDTLSDELQAASRRIEVLLSSNTD